MSAEELEKEAEEEHKKLEKEKSFNAKIQKFGKSLGMARAGIKEMAGLVFFLVSTFGLQAVLPLGMVMHADTLDGSVLQGRHHPSDRAARQTRLPRIQIAAQRA